MDRFESFQDDVTGPARSAFAVTPSDSVKLAVTPKALFVGTGGTLTLRLIDDAADIIFHNVADGQILDVRADYVRATGTTAANIVGLC